MLKQIYFSWSLFQFGWGDATCGNFSFQIQDSFECGGDLICITLLSQSRSEITCQAGNGKLQHFIGKARAKILCSNLLQSKSASYLSLSEIACNKFPPDAVSANNCFYCILKAFHTWSSSVLFKFYVLLWVTLLLNPLLLWGFTESEPCIRKLPLCLEEICQINTSFPGI